jgi:hypothetical protein
MSIVTHATNLHVSIYTHIHFSPEMKKVSSGNQLSELPHARVLGHTPLVGHGPTLNSKKPLSKSSSEESLQKTRAFVAEVSSPPEMATEIMYAVVSKGLVASECLADIELESAPDIEIDKREIAGNLAACMATPVVPEAGNGEMVNNKAAELESEVAKNVTQRYAKEIGLTSPRRLSRKRSLDIDIEAIDGQNSFGTKSIKVNEQGKQLLEIGLETQLEKNTIDIQ